MAIKRRRRKAGSAKKESARGARPAGTVRGISALAARKLRGELAKASTRSGPPRWNADPGDAQRSVARLVLALVEFLRKLMERQAIRRMEAETLTAEEVESVGQALMKLEETVHRMARQFGLRPDELNLDLGPLGKLS
jgi:hypothetical protein